MIFRGVLLTAVLSFGTVLPAPFAQAQTFAAEPALISYRLPQLAEASFDLGDYDQDGDLDLLVTGMRISGVPLTRIYELQDSIWTASLGPYRVNLPFKVFRPVESIVNNVFRGTARWGDYDGDGDQDVLLFGLAYFERNVGQPVLETVGEVYRNDRGVLVQTGIAVPGLHSGDAAWGDLDGDGDLDFAACGATSVDNALSRRTVVYLNRRGTLEPLETSLPDVALCSLAWGDYDGDGRQDLALSGEGNSGTVFSVFRSLPGNQFGAVALDGPPLLFADLAWSDYDGDGLEDLAATGGILDPHLLRGQAYLWRSSGQGLLDATPPALKGVVAGSIRWGDWDVDGRPDLFLSGRADLLGAGWGAVLLNRENGFTKELSLVGLSLGDLVVADYNGDGDDDIVLTGLDDQNRIQVLFFMNRTFPEPIPASATSR